MRNKEHIRTNRDEVVEKLDLQTNIPGFEHLTDDCSTIIRLIQRATVQFGVCLVLCRGNA